MKLTFAFCTYNRADRLEKLLAAMRSQECLVPFEILAINNNSKDNTLAILEDLATRPGATLRFVNETAQGIVPARNRAIEEALNSDILVFIDDDEIPQAGLLNGAYDAIVNEGAACAGGCVEVDFAPHGRPIWLEDDLLGFLAEVKYGDKPFWITDDSTPIWTANIAYDMSLFRNDPGLRFDKRYNRKGTDVGGGEDAIMFRALLARGAKIRYRPDMVARHFVEPWRLKRTYFLKLHYRAGIRYGRLEMPVYHKTILGVPPFLVTQFFNQCLKTMAKGIHGQPGLLRQAMNASYALGTLNGYRSR
jgi:succinoglycan biosynthesis protein ExoM